MPTHQNEQHVSMWTRITSGCFYLHTLGGHAGRLVKNLKLVPARREGVVADKVLQGWLLQPAGAEGGAAVGVLEDGVATWCTLWREHCNKDKKCRHCMNKTDFKEIWSEKQKEPRGCDWATCNNTATFQMQWFYCKTAEEVKLRKSYTYRWQ